MATKKKAGDAKPEAVGEDTSQSQESGPAASETEQAGTKAAPLEPPAIVGPPAEPALGTSTNPVAGAAAVQTMPGDRHAQLVIEVGRGKFEPADPAGLWHDESPVRTYVVAKHRIHEEYWHVGAKHPDRRLLFPAGAKVPRAQAGAIAARALEQQAQAQASG